MYGNKEFQQIQNDYLSTKSDSAWNKMFIYVQKNCELQLASICNNLKLQFNKDDFYDYSSQATMFIMGRYKKPKGYKIDSIQAVCRNAIRQVTQNPKEKFRNTLERNIRKLNYYLVKEE